MLIQYLRLGTHDRTAQRADVLLHDLANVAVFQIGFGGIVSAEPDHVAGMQRHVPGDLRDITLCREQHLAGVVTRDALAVHANLDVEVHRIEAGHDERPHRFPGIAVFRAPQRAVGFLPGAFTDVVAQRVAEDARQRVVLAQVFRGLADHRHQFALELHHVRRIGGNHDGFIRRTQRVE